jgi:hypothetical protein
MGVFQLAATMGNRTGPNRARPGWWRDRASHPTTRRPLAFLRSQPHPVDFDAPHAGPTWRSGVLWSTSNEFGCRVQPWGGAHASAAPMATTLERGPPVART